MAAHTDKQATQAFAELIERIAEEDESADLTIDDAAERGWMVPEGESLHIIDEETVTEYLVTVRKVVH
ncbi:hypothetical protein [Aquisalimonas sp.]|uniref:hypothetical protein n=1 Tax=Aquisalimonas sp. TaxID=1872621 RepID=UPI0025B8A8B1|nr:hypothetical protein [Aquisalimonas sp.]